ncbi:MAG: class I SAM-dependent methyltransferase [Anaerolineales bacterium]
MYENNYVRDYFNRTHLYLRNNPGLFIRAQAIRTLAKDISHATILDIGCGDGSLSLQFLDETEHITLLDFAPNMLELCRQKISPEQADRVSFVQSDFINFIAQDCYDVVLCIGLLAHVSSLQISMRKISHFIKPGGHVLLQFTDQNQGVGKFFSTYNRFSQRWKGLSHYELTPIWSERLIKLAEENDLSLVKENCLWTTLPGIGKMSSAIALSFLKLLNNRIFLFKQGNEKIWLLKKGGSVS